MLKYNNTDDVRRDFDRQGSHWFEPGAMAFFKTRLSDKVYGGRYFVTSEEGPNGVRAYSVRRIEEDRDGRLSIETVGEFQGHAKRRSAHKEAARLARTERHAAAYSVATVAEVNEELYQQVKKRIADGDCVVCGARLYRCDCPDGAIEDRLSEVF